MVERLHEENCDYSTNIGNLTKNTKFTRGKTETPRFTEQEKSPFRNELWKKICVYSLLVNLTIVTLKYIREKLSEVIRWHEDHLKVRLDGTTS